MTSGGFKIVTLLWILAMWRNTHWKKSLNYTNKLLFTWNINRQRSAVKSLVALWSQVFENVPFEIERALVVRWYILLNHTTSEGKQSVERERAKRIVWIINGGGILFFNVTVLHNNIAEGAIFSEGMITWCCSRVITVKVMDTANVSSARDR